MNQSSQSDQSYKAILDYLTKRGHLKAVAELNHDLSNPDQHHSPSNTNAASGSTASSPANTGGGKAVGLEDFANRNAPSQPKTTTNAGTGQAGNVTSGGTAAAAAATTPGTDRKPPPPDQAVAAGQMLADPPSWEKGYEGLRSFVFNSLDIHRPELQPLLLPLFVHSYLDLVLVGYREAADQFMNRFGSDHTPSDPHVVRMLSSLRNASHVSESEEATRWRTERYNISLSERGWGLLLAWLQGGGLALSLEGTESRGRDRVLAIINERVKIDAIPGPPSKTPTGYGLLSDFAGKEPSSKSLDPLKLGPAPIDSNLEREVTRQVKEEQSNNMEIATPTASTSTAEPGAPMAIDFADPSPQPKCVPDLVSPHPSDMLPYPQTLRTIDVMREVEKVREARKRIKLSAEAYQVVPATAGNNGQREASAGKMTDAAKPSVCLFTVHDAGDSLTTTAFSEDSTIMAAGFSESYIRLWSLKGGKLQALRNDLDPNEVKDANDLKNAREKSAPSSRKLVGHSGPVYSLSFDPVPGPSGPPRYLLSASQDTTVRLWSLDTFTNLVAYRGHREPVWDVEWGPRGIYFATASRDRTARLWSTDKIHALRIFAGHLSDVNCVRFHPNSLYIATGSSDRTCRLWDVQKGTCVRVFVGHRGAVTCLALSPDGRYLASAADDLAINLWDLASGRRIKSMTGHTSSIYSLSFSAESTVLVSASADATIRVWDVLAFPSNEDEGTRSSTNRKLGNVAGMSFDEVKGSARRASFAGGRGHMSGVNGVGGVGVEGVKGALVKGTLAEKEAKERRVALGVEKQVSMLMKSRRRCFSQCGSANNTGNKTNTHF